MCQILLLMCFIFPDMCQILLLMCFIFPDMHVKDTSRKQLIEFVKRIKNTGKVQI
jgi:hypothetical protein